MALLKRGLTGEPVRLLQEKLGVDADGIFGPGTDKALRDYQKDNGLAVDGIAGPDTFAQMGLYELVMLRVGSRGACVKKLQQALDIGDDGIFGKGTEKAVIAFQESKGLDADGYVGPETLAELDLFEEVTPEVVERSFLPIDFKMSSFTPKPKEEAAAEDAVEVPEEVAVVVAHEAKREKKKKRKGIWGTVRGMFGG